MVGYPAENYPMFFDICLKRLCEVFRKGFEGSYDLRILWTFSSTLVAGNPAFGVHLSMQTRGRQVGPPTTYQIASVSATNRIASVEISPHLQIVLYLVHLC